MPNYLYNGIELPQLPEWDKETYPYAFMCYEGANLVVNGSTMLYCAKSPFVYISSSYGYFKANPSDSVCYFVLNDGDTEWGESYTRTPSSGYATTALNAKAYWANHDVLNEDGSVYLAASEPVPVLALTERDLYRKINGQPTKLTLYKKVGGKPVPLDEYTQGGNL